MLTDRTYELITLIYATFGKSAPSRSSMVFSALQDNTSEIPDECFDWIYSKAQELDSLPSNLTKFFRSCWDMWKTDNPGRLYREACPECGGEGGTYFFKLNDMPDGSRKWQQCFSPCPVCTWIPPRLKDIIRPRCFTKRQLEERARREPNITLMPDSYKGNVARWRLEMHVDAAPENQDFNPWLEGFRQRFREGRAAAEERRQAFQKEAV